jgi:hypothetical protein
MPRGFTKNRFATKASGVLTTGGSSTVKWAKVMPIPNTSVWVVYFWAISTEGNNTQFYGQFPLAGNGTWANTLVGAMANGTTITFSLGSGSSIFLDWSDYASTVQSPPHTIAGDDSDDTWQEFKLVADVSS